MNNFKGLLALFFIAFSLSTVSAQYGATLPDDQTLEITNAIIELDFPQQGTAGQVGEYRFVESYLNDYSSYPNAYLADSIAVGDQVWDSKGDRYEVVKINNPGTNPMDFEVNALNANALAPNPGTAVIYKPTGNFGLTLQTTNVAEKLKTLIFNHNMIMIDYWMKNYSQPQVLTQNGSDVTLSGGGGTINVGDLSNTNELQTLSISGNEITISDGNTITIPSDDGTATQVQGTGIASVTGDGSAANPYSINVPAYVDPDNDAGNELQDLSVVQSGTTYTIVIDNGTDAVLDLSALDDSGTDDQTIALTGNALSIEDGNAVDLSGYLDNTDSQDMTLTGNTLSLTGDATSVDLSGFLDNTDTQDLSLSGNTLSLTDGGSVDLSGYLDDTDDQTLALSGNTLSISEGNSVDLSGYVSSDDQAISILGTVVSIEDGGSVDLASFLDNTDTQDLSLVGNTLSLTDGGSVDLSGLDDSGTDDQTIALAGNSLSIEDGNAVDLSIYLDNTDNQDLSLVGNTLNLTGDAQGVDLTAFLDNTDEQDLSLVGNTLSIENGNSVDLSGYVSSDDQVISLAGNTLSLEDGGSVDLAGYLDNTDNQDMTLTGNTLSLTGDATSVDLSGYLDNTDNQTLALVGNSLGIANGNTVDLSPYLDNTDDQQITTFSYNAVSNVLTLEIEDAGVAQTVDLSELGDYEFRVVTDAGSVGNPDFFVSATNPALVFQGVDGIVTNSNNTETVTIGFDPTVVYNWRDTVITFTNGGTGYVNVMASGTDFSGITVSWTGNIVNVANTGTARMKKVTAKGLPADTGGTNELVVRVADTNGDINQSLDGTMFPGNTTVWTKAILGGNEVWQNRQDNPPSSQMEFRVFSAGVGEYKFKNLDSYGGGFLCSVVGA